MKYIDEFRDKKLVEEITENILKIIDTKKHYRFMEVCGTHTMSIFKYGLKLKFAPHVELISGPGCPVCVTSDSYIDKAIALSKIERVAIATFGDMLKVPGSESSLEKERSKGQDVRIVYSTLDALVLARKNPQKNIVFLGVGFETTTPTVANSILIAKKENIKNYFVLSGHKLIPPALSALAKDKDIAIDGLILPAHVSTVIGSRPYEFLAKDFHMPGVITGFEPLDILQGIYMLLLQLNQGKANIEIQYNRVAKLSGNPKAQNIMNSVFKTTDVPWRGLGVIKRSGLEIKNKFRQFDAEKKFKIKLKKKKYVSKGCICGDVLKGIRKPTDCKLFKKKCSPEHPIGPCMVSSEGTCAAYFRYGK